MVYTVQEGDTLMGVIRKTHPDWSDGQVWNEVGKVAALNNIKNPNYITVGQKIKTDPKDATSTTQSTVETRATIVQFGIQSNSSNTIFATWDWNRENTKEYKVIWSYSTGDGVWFVGSNTSITVDADYPNGSKQSTYSIPANATQIKFKVKPISETYEKNKTETAYWTAEWSTEKTHNVSDNPPKTPAVPTVAIEKYKLTAHLDNLDLNATSIQFQVVKNNATVFNTGTVTIVTDHASYSCAVDAGGEYKVRCRSCRDNKYSDWSDYSANNSTMPATPDGITVVKAISETSVYLEWSAADTAASYDIEYATKIDYFDGSDQTTSITGIEYTHYEKTGLESGTEYFFRVRAVNDKGNSAWSNIKSVVIGKAPVAPTTWSSTTTAITGEPLILYWVHNAEDGSSQTYAELEIYVGGAKETYTVQNSTNEEEKDRTSSFTVDTTAYVEGTKIQWRVRTAGITKAYGDWSVQRTVDIYAPPTLELSLVDSNGRLLDTVNAFPVYISGLAGPNTQLPIGYHLSVISNEVYETVDNIGNVKTVNKGEEVYSKYFDVTDSLMVELSANNIDLENNVGYSAKCAVSMDSGLTAEASLDFTVSWIDVQYKPNAEIGIDTDSYTASIRPYCKNGILVNYKVNLMYGAYTRSDEQIEFVYGDIVPGAMTITGERVFQGITGDGDEVYYCSVEETVPVENILMSVYRREFDGSFTELATGLDVSKTVTITDPHPALDFARYRIVAISKDTGAVSYYDPPGYPVGANAVIIQWDETWTSFETSEENSLVQPAWSGSMLKLPYNIDVSDKNKPDVALIAYIGRTHPTSYYGTHLGATSTWNVEIVKDDEETLYALRRLSRWMGDVYVREPSGSGYWANVTVSFNQKHCALTIPVTLEITRVEGGA